MAETGDRFIVPSEHEQLKTICWNRDPTRPISRSDAFAIYERNWRFVAQEELCADEERLIRELIDEFGHGMLLVSAPGRFGC
jgi:hypothetical protein